MAIRLGTLMGVVAALQLAPPSPAAQPVARLPWWNRSAEARVGQYWIRTDLAAQRADELAAHLNIMYEEFSRRLVALPARAPARMNVLLFADAVDYLETLQFKYGIDATGTGGMFFVNASGSALAVWVGDLPRRRIEHVLQHEGFHQFAWSRFGTDLPLWVNEGLAEFFGDAVVVGRSVIIGQSSAAVVQDVKARIERGTVLEFPRMLAMSPEQWSTVVRDGDAQGLYHQAWSMVHFLVYGDGGRYVGSFERYLKLLNTGFPPQRAFERAFETDDIVAFEKRWRQYAMSARPSGFLTALDRMEFMAEGARELAQRGTVPDSLDELREALEAIGFSYSRSRHDLSLDLRVSRSMFEIPWTGNDQIEQRPVFVVNRPARYQMPSSIETAFLKPRDLSVQWFRDPATHTFRYEIKVRPRSP